MVGRSSLSKLRDLIRSRFSRLITFFLLIFMGIYRTLLTAHLGGCCRFEPSCSLYAVEALRYYSPLRALQIIAIRLCKCRPWGPWGYDPLIHSDNSGRIDQRNL